jgi:Xaa-Pro dipeptidase
VLDFRIEEFRSRVTKAQKRMVEEDLPVLLLHAPENIAYISGFRMLGFFMYQAVILPREGDPILVVRDVEQPAADETSWLTRRSVYIDLEDPIDATARALRELGLDGERIGLEFNTWFLTQDRLASLKTLLPRASFVPEPNIVRGLRLIKSPAEIEYLRKASRVVEAMALAVLDTADDGVSEREVAAAMTRAQILSGGESFLEPILMTGPRTKQLHGTWSDRVIAEGDNVYFELNGVVGGYWSKLMRTAVVGKPSATIARAADIVIGALSDGISMMRPGADAGAIDAALREPVLKAGLRASYYHRTGYTMGLVYPPSSGEYLREFMAGDTWRLEAGQTFHMLVLGGGVGFSETVLVTDEGPDLLTRFDRKLFEL